MSPPGWADAADTQSCVQNSGVIIVYCCEANKFVHQHKVFMVDSRYVFGKGRFGQESQLSVS